MAGVVLEAHLSEVCDNHNVTVSRRHPTIADYNELLKGANVLDTPRWRELSRFSDIRNYCGHKKEREPTIAEVEELLDGVDKYVKTLF